MRMKFIGTRALSGSCALRTEMENPMGPWYELKGANTVKQDNKLL
jgi:hypothetical protein